MKSAKWWLKLWVAMSIASGVGVSTASGTTATLTLAASSRSFTAAAANSKELGVTANVSWTAKSSASWLAVKTGSGKGNGKIVYNVAANTGTASRTAKITVAGGGLTRTFTVTQSGKTVAALTLGTSSGSCGSAAASNLNLSVTANVNWTAESGASWLTLKKTSGSGNGTIVYEVTENTSSSPPPTVLDVFPDLKWTGSGSRTATITVTGGGISRTFKVTQNGTGDGWSNETIDGIVWYYTISSGKAEARFAKYERERGYRIALAGDIVVPTFLVGAQVTSIGTRALSPVTGMNALLAASMTVTIPVGVTNIGEHVMAACWGLTEVTLPDGLKSIGRSTFLDCPDLPMLTIPNSVTSIGWNLFYLCNLETLYVPVSWKSKYVNGEFWSSYAAVPTGCKVVYGSPQGQLTLGASLRYFTADAASNKELEVRSDVSWTAKSSESWLTVKTPSGSGNGTIVYNVEASTNWNERTARIYVRGGGWTRVFSVCQYKPGNTKRMGVQKPELAWVTTSDGSEGDAVADGDEGTGWSPDGTGGAWVALSFEEARDVGSVEVVGDGLPEGIRALVSQDGDNWSEEGGEAVNYLWVILPDEGAVPTVREIVTKP